MNKIRVCWARRMEASTETSKTTMAKISGEAVALTKIMSEAEEETDEEVKFSDDAVSKLSQRLSREITATTNHKQIYLKVNLGLGVFVKSPKLTNRVYSENWLELDVVHDDDGCSQIHVSWADPVMMENNFPKKLRKLEDYGCAVWKSKILIAGGRARQPTDGSAFIDSSSDKIYIYDTLAKTWDTARMKNVRDDVPLLVVAEDRVLIFGGSPMPNYADPIDEDEDELARCFCEYFDFDSGGKPTFPSYPPKGSLAGIRRICYHAVYPNRKQILIWKSANTIISLDYKNFRLETFIELDVSVSTMWTAQLFDAPIWCSQAAVLEDFLFWCDPAAIYALDLHQRRSLPVYAFPHIKSIVQLFDAANRVSAGDFSSRKLLLPVGKGMLCLLGIIEKKRICFATFKVTTIKNGEAPHLHLTPDKAGFLRTPVVTSISSALGISS